MTKPANFTSTTDYPTLKNDGKYDAMVVIPASISVPGNGYVEYYADITAGTAGTITSSRVSSSKDSNTWYQARQVIYTRTGTNSFGSTIYNIAAFVWRPSATVLRCQIHIINPDSLVFTGETSAETISFHINTFVPPFA